VTRKEVLAYFRKPTSCPKCGEPSNSCGEPSWTLDCKSVMFRHFCQGCGAGWVETYTLSAFSIDGETYKKRAPQDRTPPTGDLF
jgi:hypothetical protein